MGFSLLATHTSMTQGVSSLWSESAAVADNIAHKITSLVSLAPHSVPAEQEQKVPPTEELQTEADAERVLPTLTDEDMEALMAQTHDDAYPLMPNAPVVVAAASCEEVVLRWRGVENDAAWPIQGYVLQRFPDKDHQLEWETLLEWASDSDTTDRNVRVSQQYLYRVQAISGGARSSFAYHAVTMNQSSCHASASLLAYLPSALHSLPLVSTITIEAVQTFVLIMSCFLAVFGVMRSNVLRVQHTRSRQGRLRKMEKSTLAETSAARPYALPRLSSSEASTDAATSVTDLLTSSRGSQFESSRSLGGLLPSRENTVSIEPARGNNAQRAASFSTPLDKAVCHYCHKKFGIFRRRRVCDVCQTVALCRKCGVQAPTDCDVAELRDSLIACDGDGDAARSHSQQTSTGKKHLRKRRVKTICHDCGAHAQRFSTSRASVSRPL